MSRIISFTLYFILLLNLQLFSQQVGKFTKTFDDRGTISSIYVSIPTIYDKKFSYPLLIAWHGAGDTGNNMRYIIDAILGSKINAILLCPDANKVNGKDTSYFYNLLREAYNFAKANYNIDTNKTVIMGFSWGGGFAFQNGLNFPSMFKGIIGHAPAIGDLNTEQWGNINKIRMSTILGDKDFNWTAVNGLMTKIKDKGANILYIVKPGVVHVDNNYFNSQAIIDDYRKCYEYVISNSTQVNEENLPIPIVKELVVVSNFIQSENIGELEIYNLNGYKLGNISYPYLLPDELLNGVYYLKSVDKNDIRFKLLILH